MPDWTDFVLRMGSGPSTHLVRLTWRVGHPVPVGWMCWLGSRLLGKRVGSISGLMSTRSLPFHFPFLRLPMRTRRW